MIKADAYGHGLLPVAEALEEADGFGVARLQEALALRGAGISKRILVLGTLLNSTDLALCSAQNIDVTAHDESTVLAILRQLQHGALRIWLKLDSGMHRLGLDQDAFLEADRRLSAQVGALELVHMTHFSCADNSCSPSLERQMQRFSACCKKRTHDTPISMANSAALLSRPETRVDWVRPGIMLYGINPTRERHSASLRVAMRVSSMVIALRNIGTNEPVGYNERWTSARASRIATVGFGYADGYPRQAANGTPVWVQGQSAPLVGQVSMDSLTIDVTDVSNVEVGSPVTLWGPELPVESVAEHAQTIPYQLFSGVSQRVCREYVT